MRRKVSRRKRPSLSNQKVTVKLSNVDIESDKLGVMVQEMDLGHQQACKDLEKATQCITQTLQREVVKNQELCMLIRRLEEREAETLRILTEQVEANKQLKLKIDELQKHLQEKHNSLTQDNQILSPSSPVQSDQRSASEEPPVCSEPLISPEDQQTAVLPAHFGSPASSGVENAPEDYSPLVLLDCYSLSLPVSYDAQDQLDCSNAQSPSPQMVSAAFSPSPQMVSAACSPNPQMVSAACSPSPQMVAAAWSLSPQMVSAAFSLNPPVSSHTQDSQVVRIKEENVLQGYEESRQPDGVDLRTDQVASADIKVEQTQASLMSSDGLNLLEAPVSEDKDEEEEASLMSSDGLNLPEAPVSEDKDEEDNDDDGGDGDEENEDCSRLGNKSQAQLKGVSVVLVDLCKTQGGPAKAEKKGQDLQPSGKGLTCYRCTLCGKSFAHKRNLGYHQRIHARERKYHCTLCSKSFTQESSLERHQHMHTGERPYHCTHCGTGFTLQKNLKVHQRIHTGNGLYHCTLCGRSFTQEAALKIHQRTHTGEKPFHCTECGKRFTREATLKRHHRIHTGERPYHCSQCGKTFAHVENLNRHKRTHTGEKPYHCTWCDKSYAQEYDLKRHLHNHAGEST